MGSLGEIRVTGQVKVRLQAECDRCLEPAGVSGGFQFRAVLSSGSGRVLELRVNNAARRGRRPEAAIAARAVRVEEKSLDAGEAEMGFYEGDGLELNDVLREFVLLALPMQKLCDENCKGICPVCGQNRNQNECRCQTAAGDDRWAALKEIRKNAES